jgi:hypothetical protein
LEFDIVNILIFGRDTFIVIVHSHGQDTLGAILTDHILIQMVFDFGRLF